ncbi:Peroxiredoxin-like 2C [Psilocybe cubensis]|uniref:Peroxiredoxin-like 2C n=2 Tax=Psilocybe cubensis TaxID=181762 RepID=A0ACB8H1Y6_PSICU|nr:Peroxiredoxin-like 2C [Psilocybe cubensis]KAH9481709.1 Peroxiredoxin-like 2C [Psilocybe cubensis]
MAVASPSSSFQDLRAATVLSGHRIPRKPPPVIDQFERYPSPDPSDPFAPLWVLRNRTSSGLPGTHSPFSPGSGPYGSLESLSNLGERRYSSSYLEYSPPSSATTQSRPHTSYNAISPPGSPLKAVSPKHKATKKAAHYTPYSQINQKGGNPVGSLQAFPRIATPCQSRTDIDLASPKSKRPWPPRNDTLGRSSQLRHDVHANDRDDNCSSESETDEDDAYIKPLFKLKSPIFLRPSTPQLYSQTKPKSNATHQRAQSVQTNGSQKLSPQTRLARIFLPRKFSFLHHDSVAPAGSRRPSTADSRTVSKSAISAPQAMVSTATLDHSRNKSHPSRGRASTISIRSEVNEMKGTDMVDIHEHHETKLSQKQTEMRNTDETRSTIINDCGGSSFKHLKRVLYPLTVTELSDKPDSDDRHRLSLSLDIDVIASSTNSKRRSSTTVCQVLNMASPQTPTGKYSSRRDGPSDTYLPQESQIPLSPSMTVVEPFLSSASNMSNANFSISAPSFATNMLDDDHKFTDPRPAPRPPMFSVKPLLLSQKRSKGNKQQRDLTTDPTTPTVPVSSTSAKCAIPPSGILFPTEWTLPTPPQITFAASLPLTCEDGTHVTFGSLFASTRTIVVFIRHFWCPLCQDYMTSLKSLVRPEMLAEWPAGSSAEAEDLRERLVKFVVISNGAHGMIPKYRQMFGLPFQVYTDPKLAVYHALGMGKDGQDCHHTHQNHRFYQYQQHQVRQKQSLGPSPTIGATEGDADGKEENKGGSAKTKRKSGGYVKHSTMGGIAMVVARAIKFGMPVWEKGGNVDQLGGEFIFGPGLTCSFAHRMQTTKGHAPIEDVLTAAGIDVSRLSRGDEPPFDSTSLSSNTESIGPDHLRSDGDLPIPPRLTPLRHQQHRRRISSLRTLKESLALNRATSTASALSAKIARKASINNGNMDNEGVHSRRQTHRYSVGVNMGVNFVSNAGIMSREEEERWMVQRQISMEKMRERKMLRRMLGRAASAQGYVADVSVASSAASSVIDVKMGRRDRLKVEDAEKVAVANKKARDELEDMEVMGKMDEDLGLDSDTDKERETSDAPGEIGPVKVDNRLGRRRTMDSFSDTASMWSRDTAPPPEGGSYVFFHDVVL